MINTHQYILIFFTFHALSAVLLLSGTDTLGDSFLQDKHNYVVNQYSDLRDDSGDTSYLLSEDSFDKTVGNTFKEGNKLKTVMAVVSPSFVVATSNPSTFEKRVLLYPMAFIEVILWIFFAIWAFDKFKNKSQSNA